MRTGSRFFPFLVVLLLSTLIMAVACKGKPKKDPEDAFFPALDFIKSQVAAVDTSLYAIMRLTERKVQVPSTDSSHASADSTVANSPRSFIDSVITDTEYIHRDLFRGTAVDFLSIPDLADDEYSDRYTETRQMDPSINRVVITYTPKTPEKELIQMEQVTIEPDPAAGDKVRNIIINTVQNSRDSSIEKRLLWNVDQSFKVTIMKQLPGKPEQVNTFKLSWNEHDYE